ncbi:MAG TPA: PorP/SprF family type IX secretion system membrane protein [Bacteroidales bacterium]|nr:PorP/SprF family type IX secretion system membrane protein [Bacteroidales bacterium]
MPKKHFLILLLIGIPLLVKSQQTAVYSQYMDNAFVFNSALAGDVGLTKFSLISKQQWMGMDLAPRTFSLSAQTRLLLRKFQIKSRPLKKNKMLATRSGRVGVGLNVTNDRNGYFQNTTLTGSYAYHIPFTNSQLSLGLSGSLSQLKIDKSGIVFREAGDPKEAFVEEPAYAPDIGVGIQYKDFESYYFGFSISNIIQTNIRFGNTTLNYNLKRHYYLMAGYRKSFTNTSYIDLTTLAKSTELLMPQIDLSAKVVIKELYWLGLSYRSTTTAIFLAGVYFRNFLVGYAFDYDFNSFNKVTVGSHELNLSLWFGDSSRRYKWIRRF